MTNWSNEWNMPITPSRFADEQAKEADKQCSKNQKVFDEGKAANDAMKVLGVPEIQQIKLGNKTISVIVVGDLGLDFCEPGEKDEGWNIYHLPTLQSVNSAVPGIDVCPICSGDCASANPPMIYCPMQNRFNYDKPELLRWMAKVQTNYPTSWEVLRVLTPDDYHDKGTVNKEIIKKWCLSVKVE